MRPSSHTMLVSDLYSFTPSGSVPASRVRLDLLVSGGHARAGERTGVLDFLTAHAVGP